MKRTRASDVYFEDTGSVFLITPLSAAAREWIADNLQAEGWQFLGASLAVDRRYVADIAEGMIADGLVVR